MMIAKSAHQDSTCTQCEQPKVKHCCYATYRRNKIIEYVDYDDWLPNVRILAPEVPDSILLDFIRRGCIEFAIRSKCLTRDIHIEPQDCVADYYPCLGEQERIDIVHHLGVDGYCYTSVGDTCNWDVGDSKFWFHPPNTLEIHPAPKSDSKLCKGDTQVILNVVAIPSEDSDQVDKFIKDRYFQAIVHFAVGEAHLIPNMPATSGEAHTYRLNEFKKYINRAKIDLAQRYSSDLRSIEEIRGGHGCMC